MKSIKHPFSGRIGGAAGADNSRDIGYDYRRVVGNYVRERREKAGLTQRELGKAVGVMNNAISAIELGRNPIPPERYRAFSEALGISPRTFGNFLLEWTDPWLFALIHGDEKAARHNLAQIPDRIANPDRLDVN